MLATHRDMYLLQKLGESFQLLSTIVSFVYSSNQQMFAAFLVYVGRSWSFLGGVGEQSLMGPVLMER